MMCNDACMVYCPQPADIKVTVFVYSSLFCSPILPVEAPYEQRPRHVACQVVWLAAILTGVLQHCLAMTYDDKTN